MVYRSAFITELFTRRSMRGTLRLPPRLPGLRSPQGDPARQVLLLSALESYRRELKQIDQVIAGIRRELGRPAADAPRPVRSRSVPPKRKRAW